MSGRNKYGRQSRRGRLLLIDTNRASSTKTPTSPSNSVFDTAVMCAFAVSAAAGLSIAGFGRGEGGGGASEGGHKNVMWRCLEKVEVAPAHLVYADVDILRAGFQQ